MMIALSMSDANDFVESAILDGVKYRLHFSWNGRMSQWTLDIRDAGNSDIVRGIAIVPNFPLLRQYKRHGIPRGEIVAVVVKPDLDGNQSIGRKDFVDGKFTLVYIPEREVLDILGTAE